MRLGQRLVGALTAPTGEGKLYEIDTRLRPSGNKGPTAVRLDGFTRYYEDSAWTWEMMALTRARIVLAPPALAARLRRVIAEIPTRRHDRDQQIGRAHV